MERALKILFGIASALLVCFGVAAGIGDSLLADGIFPLLNLVFAVIAWRVGRGDPRMRPLRIYMVVAQLVWMVSNILWAYDSYVAHTVPGNDLLVVVLMLAPNVLYAVGFTLCVQRVFAKRDVYLMMSDTFMFSVVAFVASARIVFGDEAFTSMPAAIPIIESLYVIFDMYLLLLVSVVGLTKEVSYSNATARAYFLGALLPVITDVTDNIMTTTGIMLIDNLWSDFLYLAGALLLLLGMQREAKDPFFIEPAPPKRRGNAYQRVVALVLIGVTLAGAVAGLFNIPTFAVLVISCMAYWIMSLSFQASMLSETLLVQQRQINVELQLQVAEKTRELVMANRELRKSAITDTLTGLYNRRYADEYLMQLADKSDAQLTVFYLDLNKFKSVNDNYGHRAGDQVLAIAGGRLLGLNIPESCCFRMGGDEFMVVTRACLEGDELDGFCQQLLQAFAEPMVCDEQVFYLSSSLGVARMPLEVATPEAAVTAADAAMYSIKQERIPGRWRLYVEGMRGADD